MRIRRALAAVAIAATVSAACSGDDGTDGSATPSPTTTAPAPTTTAPGADVASPTVVDGPVEGGRWGVPHNPMPEGFTDSVVTWDMAGTAHADASFLLPADRDAFVEAADAAEVAVVLGR